MPLIPLADIESDLVSPCCKAPLEGSGNYKCRLCSRAFPVVGGWPVLVDFDRSILFEEQVLATKAGSHKERQRWSRIRRVLTPENRVAAKNVGTLLSLLPDRARILVVGGGTIGSGIEAVYATDRVGVVGFDIYGSPNVQLVSDAHQIPFADGAFDAVIVQAILEHVLDPPTVVDEIWRVLRADGFVYAETPFLQQVHEGPYDFQRFTESGHRWLFRRFRRLHSGVVGGPGNQLWWTINYTVRSLLRSRLAGIVARTLFLPVRFLDRLVPERFAIDSATGFFFLGQRAAGELTPKEMVSYYRGAQ